MSKIYVLDTNVLIQAPYAIECFEENEVVLPMIVLEELDNQKKVEGEKGVNIRTAIRKLELYRNKGDLIQGVETSGGGTLRVEKNFINVELSQDLPEYKSDNRILKVCVGLAEKREEQVVLVTKDILLRIKAELLGIKAEDFMTEQVVEHNEQYLGRKELYVPEELFKEFKKKGIPVENAYFSDKEGNKIYPELFENEFIILKADQSSGKTQLGRVEKGMAGTSKTFYSLAVGLEKLLNNPTGEYRRILICRTNALFDSDIGFLPGDEQEKISPLMRPIIDNLEQLVDSSEKERYLNEQELSDKIQEIFERGIIQTEALTFIRGRSIVKTYLIIDEVQNMTPAQIKGLITRAGKDTKIILLGDPNQIDRPYLDDRTNGLSYAAEHMKGSPLCWQITLLPEECERSALAMDAIHRL